MHRVRFILPFACLCACLLLLLGLQPTPAHAADAIVGDGTPASCTESALTAAIVTVETSGGGTVTFNCGGARTIPITIYQEISGTVTIDGGGVITLSGGGTSPFFQVFATAALTLTDIILTDGFYFAAHPLENFGTLTLEGVTVSDSGVSGSALTNYGTLRVRNSTFDNNTLNGNNETRGAAINNQGTSALITNSTFSDNRATVGTAGGALGGAIANISGAMTVQGSTFRNNSALDGGAVYVNSGSAFTVTQSVFDRNQAGYGGAIETMGIQLEVINSRFTNNRAAGGDGGAIWILSGDLDADQVQFDGNEAATTGGAVSCYGGFVSIINSALINNDAATNGGAIYSTCNLNLTNITVSGNTATLGGGGIYQADAGSATVQYATIANNSAAFGAGIYNDGLTPSTLNIGKSIVAFNSTGNCDGVIVSDGYNLTNDTGCAAFAHATDRSNATVPLEPVGNYGGPTSTRPPTAGNEAINHIPAADCGFAQDQRGVARPQDGDCDSGAFEGTAVRKTYLPLVQ